MERYRRNADLKDKTPFKTKFVRQCVVCGIIVGVVFVISLLKSDTAAVLTERIEYTLSYTVDYKSAVMDIVEKIKSIVGGM